MSCKAQIDETIDCFVYVEMSFLFLILKGNLIQYRFALAYLDKRLKQGNELIKHLLKLQNDKIDKQFHTFYCPVRILFVIEFRIMYLAKNTEINFLYRRGFQILLLVKLSQKSIISKKIFQYETIQDGPGFRNNAISDSSFYRTVGMI